MLPAFGLPYGSALALKMAIIVSYDEAAIALLPLPRKT